MRDMIYFFDVLSMLILNMSRVKYMPHLDGVRGFAVLSVILQHWQSGLPSKIRIIVESIDFGALGVECFFVLSGFLITLILLQARDDEFTFRERLGHFYIRRALRIFPPYYLFLAVCYFAYQPSREFIYWNALYINNLYSFFYNSGVPFGAHFWSLAVEEHFYLFWPFIVLAVPYKNVKIIAYLLILLGPFTRLLLYLIYGGFHLSEYYFTLAAFDLMSVGAFLACLKHEGRLVPGERHFKTLMASGLIAFACYITSYFIIKNPYLGIFQRTFSALMFGALIVKASFGFNGHAKKLFGNAFIVWIGTISYGLYIYHPFITGLYIYIMGSFAGLDLSIWGIYYIRFPLLFLMLLLITIFSYYFVERPIRNLKRLFRL
ncbi:MAG: acyltransferase family protein [Gammaproteobacteria bacterium]